VIQFLLAWRLSHFMMYSFDDCVRRFVKDRQRLLREVVKNCENLLGTVSSFEAACSSGNDTVSETSLCRGVWRIRSDAQACMERISTERELISQLSSSAIILGLAETETIRFSFYNNLVGFMTKPGECEMDEDTICIDWPAIFCIDLFTSLVFSLLPFGANSGSRVSLLIAIIAFSFARGVWQLLVRRIHNIIRRLRLSRIVFLLYPFDWLVRCDLLTLSAAIMILISSYTVVGPNAQHTLFIQIIISTVRRPISQTLYFFPLLYSVFLIMIHTSQISNEIRTRLSLEELKEIDDDIIRLWSEGSVVELERLSDAALIEYLLRVDITRLESTRCELSRILHRRPCLRTLLDERNNVKSLYCGDLQRLSERLCIIFHGRQDMYIYAGSFVGILLVVAYVSTQGIILV